MKKIFYIVGLIMCIALVGCSNNSSENIDNETQNNTESVTYVMTEESEDIDSETNEWFDITNKDQLSIIFINDSVHEVQMKSEYDYSKASTTYVNELYEDNKATLVDEYNKNSGVEMSISKNDKNIILESAYELQEIDNATIKDYIHINCGLDPEKYNDDGTYPLSDLEKALEEKGFTKES